MTCNCACQVCMSGRCCMYPNQTWPVPDVTWWYKPSISLTEERVREIVREEIAARKKAKKC